MSFRSDDRGAAIQVGAIILFAFVIIAITAYQASVVPNQNNQIEYNHNQQVQSQLQDLESAIGSTSSVGERRTVTVDLGTEYPARTIFVNPPNPSGRLETVGTDRDAVAFEIRNATAVDEDVRDFWNGRAHNYSTGSVVYRPNYNVYSEAPMTVIENSLVYNRFDTSNITVKSQSVFDGNEISLTAIRGSLSEQGRTASVGVEAVSVSSKTITIEDTGGDPVTVTTVSMLSRSEWHSMIDDAGEFHNQSGHVQAVRPNGSVTLPNGETAYRIDFVMETGEEYTLQIASVGVGDLSESDASTTANYTVAVTDRVTTDEGVTESVTVEVRDEYNNPKAGVEVEASVSGDAGGTLENSSGQTNSEGRVTFEYEAGNIDGEASKTDYVNVSFTGDPASGFNASDPANVSVRVTVRNTDRSGMSGGGNNAYGVFWQEPSASNTGSPCDADRCVVDGGASLPLVMGTNPVADGANVEYAVNDTSVAELARTTGTTNASGENATVLEFNSAGTVRVYTSSGAGGDTIVVEIQLASGVVWKETLDWDSAVSEDGVVHEGFGDRESDRVAVGYPSGGEWGPQPVAYFPLDEDTGSTANEVVNGNDGTVTGTPQGSTGVLGTTSYDFDGTTDFVDLSSGSGSVSGSISGGSYTWTGWVQAPNSGITKTIVGAEDGSGNYPFIMFLYNGQLWVYGEGTSYSSSDVAADGTWHHVAVSYDSSTDQVQVYVDGQPAGGDFPRTLDVSLSSNDLLRIGRYDGDGTNDGWMNGKIDELQAFDQALSQAEVQQLYDASTGGTLETDARSSGSEFNVSTLELTNVSVDPNGGDVTVYVQSDHDEDGSFEETSDPITLSAGTSTYDVNGLSTDSSNFSLVIDFTTADVTSSPWVSAIEINGSTAGSGTNPPTITNFEATNPSGQTVEVSFDSSKTLSDIEVNLNYDSNGSTAETLTTSDFSSSGGTYTATTTLPTGSYTAILQTAKDNDGNDGALGQSDTVTVSTVASGPPAVTSASVQDAPINYSDAAPGETKTVTITFNQSMDTNVDPTVKITGLPESNNLTVSANGWVDSTTWEGTVDFPRNADDANATIRIADAEDADGNTMSPNPDTSETVVVDTDRPNDPAETRIVTDPVNASNDGSITVEVDVDNPDADGGTVYVRLEGKRGTVVVESASMQTGSGTVTTTVSGIDVSALADADPGENFGLNATARVVDDVGNENPSGYAARSDGVLKDTNPPTIDQFNASNPSGSTIDVVLQVNETLSDISVDVEDANGNVVSTLVRGDFTQNCVTADTCYYNASVTVSDNDDYTAVLNTARDDAGNDGASGETDTATVFTYDNQVLQPVASVGDEISSSNNQLTFEIENPNGPTVEVGAFAVNTTAITPGNTIDDNNNPEFTITGSTTAGEANRQGNPKSFAADGTVYLIEADSNNGGSNATIAQGDGVVTVDMRQFASRLDNGGSNPLVLTTDPSEADVVVVFETTDGTRIVFYFKQA